MKTYPHKSIGSLFSIVLLSFLLMLGGCNKDFPNKLQVNFKNDTLGVNAKTRKVLYIIVDGIRGRALQGINPPNIAQLVKKSIYSYDGLADVDGVGLTNAGSWANMLTGVKRDQHKIISEDFAGNNLTQYPSIITRLKQNNGGLRTASFSASAAFSNKFTGDAIENKTFEGNDLSVKNAAKEELKKEEATFVLAQFHSAEAAGSASGYEETNNAYANAILQLDTYIGDLMNTLSQRKNVAGENWLVVIASNKGGVIATDPNSTDFTSYADPLRNNFVLFYNPRFSSLFIPKPDSEKIPYSSTGIRFDYATGARVTASIANPAKYDFGALGNYTVEVLMKSKTGNYIYPTFLSKRVTAFEGAGWNMFLENGYWMINSSIADQVKGRDINDGKWHKLTVVFDGANKKIRVYTDGQFDAEKATDKSNLNLNNPASLRLGYIPGNENTSATVMLNSLKIFNVALTTADVSAYSCKTVIAQDNPKYNNLIGYWPLQDGNGNIMKEKTGKGDDFQLGGAPQWESFNDVSPALCPEINAAFFTMVPNNIDIPFQIYQWMGVSVSPQWGLKGKTWDPIYSDIKP